MKIHTVENLLDCIDDEMAWRRKELTSIKSSISTARSFAKNTAIRAGVALLYSHWEGAVKNIATYYLEFVSRKKLLYSELRPCFLALTIKKEVSLIEQSNKNTIHSHIVSEVLSKQAERSCIPFEGVIKTNSNLNSTVLAEIMSSIGLSTKAYESSYNFIDEVLLAKRNCIAHGERLEILDLDEERYYEMQDKILTLLDMFRTDIINAATLEQYKVSKNHGEFMP